MQLGRLVMYYYRGGGLSSKNNPAAALSPHPRCLRSKLVQKSFACATIRLLRLCWQPHRISGAVQLPAVTASVKLNPTPDQKKKTQGANYHPVFLRLREVYFLRIEMNDSYNSEPRRKKREPEKYWLCGENIGDVTSAQNVTSSSD